MLAVAAISMNAQTAATFNFFDPADCDADGWLWLDTPEKIAKYVGPDKKLKLVNAPYEIEDPEFPGEMVYPESTTDPYIKGYNNKGEQGGEGSKTGAIILPAAEEHHAFWGDHGGAILVNMPDCATFDVYLSQELPDTYTWLEVGKGYFGADELQYLWNEEEPDKTWDGSGKPLTTDYIAWDMNIQNHLRDISFGDGDWYSFHGEKGNPRSALFGNYSLCPMLVQGIRIFTYTDVSLDQSSVEAIGADAVISINGKTVTTSATAEINVYTISGAKVASAYGTSLDCSALKGIYIVKVGGKSVKAVF